VVRVADATMRALASCLSKQTNQPNTHRRALFSVVANACLAGHYYEENSGLSSGFHVWLSLGKEPAASTPLTAGRHLIRRSWRAQMLRVGAAATVGIIIALVLIYWLEDLNAGAVALLVVLCVGVAELLVGAFALLNKRRTDK
jgi:hypothetical protein